MISAEHEGRHLGGRHGVTTQSQAPDNEARNAHSWHKVKISADDDKGGGDARERVQHPPYGGHARGAGGLSDLQACCCTDC